MSAYLKRIGTRLSSLFTGGVLMREQKMFLSTVSLFFIATTLSGIFVNTFIYSCAYASGKTVSALHAVAYYNLCMYASMALFSVIIGIVGKTISTRVLMCIGIVFYAFLYILLLVWGIMSIKYIWVLGFLSGMGAAVFNLNYSGAVTYATSNESRTYYLALQGIINSIVAVLAPFLAGVISALVGGMNGYITLFIISLLILSSSIVCGFGLSYNDGKKGGTQFGNVFVFSIKDKGFRYCAFSDIISGLRDGVSIFLIPMLLFSIRMSNFLVGVYMLVFAAVQVVMSEIAKRYITDKNRMGVIFLTSVVHIISAFVLFSGVDMLSIFSYGVMSALAQGVFVTAAFAVFYNAAYKIPHGHRKNLEILSVREFYINIGKIIGIFIVMLVMRETTYVIFTMFIFGILQILSWFTLMLATRENKSIIDETEQENIKFEIN